MDDPIDLARRAGYLDHFRGIPATDHPPFDSLELIDAWYEGWNQRRADVDGMTWFVTCRTPGKPGLKTAVCHTPPVASKSPAESELDAVRSSTAERENVNLETPGPTPAALPC